MKLYKAVENVPMDATYKIFLAGSIEMGKATDWQTDITRKLSDVDHLSIMNPRRDDWDDSWVQSISDPKFNEQVTWEMNHLNRADLIVMYFDPETKSPVTLLELGLHANGKDNHLIVCCPDGFWRKGNIEMVCDKYGIELLNDYQNFLTRVRDFVTANAKRSQQFYELNMKNFKKSFMGIDVDK